MLRVCIVILLGLISTDIKGIVTMFGSRLHYVPEVKLFGIDEVFAENRLCVDLPTEKAAVKWVVA